jgi:hypothetical protein
LCFSLFSQISLSAEIRRFKTDDFQKVQYLVEELKEQGKNPVVFSDIDGVIFEDQGKCTLTQGCVPSCIESISEMCPIFALTSRYVVGEEGSVRTCREFRDNDIQFSGVEEFGDMCRRSGDFRSDIIIGDSQRRLNYINNFHCSTLLEEGEMPPKVIVNECLYDEPSREDQDPLFFFSPLFLGKELTSSYCFLPEEYYSPLNSEVYPISFSNGAIHTSAQDKGLVIKLLCSLYGWDFDTIVFIDNTQSNIDAVVSAFADVADVAVNVDTVFYTAPSLKKKLTFK